jgi:ADP-ribose pyrophosphatase YjhB (NUDIX family)
MPTRAIFCPPGAGNLTDPRPEPGMVVPVCTVCGYKFYQNSKPCVVAIILDARRERILLSRRGIEPFKGDWDLPGGFLRDGEDPREGTRREVREELGVEAEVGDIFDILVDTYGPDGVYTFNVCYYVRIPEGAVLTAMDDVAELSWFPLDAPPANLAFRLIGDLLRRIRKGKP